MKKQLTMEIGKRLIAFILALIFLSGAVKLPGYPVQTALADDEVVNTFILHYYQYPGERNYTDWDAWIWEKGKDGKGYPFDNYTPDNDGWITLTAKLTGECAEIGLIVRKNDWTQKSNSQDITIQLNDSKTTEVWHLHGENKVYTNKDDVSIDATPLAALADAPGKILVTMNFGQDNLDSDQFKLYNITDQVYVDVYNVWQSASSMIVSTDHAQLGANKSTIKVNKQYEVRYSADAIFEEYRTCAVTMRDILNSYATTATDLGLSYSAANCVFKVWAPTAVSVDVAIYQGLNYGEDYESDGKIKITKLTAPDSSYPMTCDTQGLWSASINGNLKGQYYMYLVTFPDGTAKYAVDPYTRAVSANGQLGAIIDLTETGSVHSINKDVANARNIKLNSSTDHIIYEMHIRDFTIHSSSGVTGMTEVTGVTGVTKVSDAGKYKGAFETGTTVPGSGGVKTGIDHLVELGVTTVHFLPIFDGGSVNELGDLSYGQDGAMNWGYDPQNYNVPEGSYSSNPRDPYARIKELKALISALHDNGIRVVMDVVYNHTYSIADGPFDKIVPGYFYRTWNDGSFSNGSGCGNETASERAMVRKFMLDSLQYWQREFCMDGFRFDLMALHDNKTMYTIAETLKKNDPDCVIYGEPWVAGDTPLPAENRTTNGKQFGKGFAIFNDDVREAIRGDHSTTTSTDPQYLGGFAGGAPQRNGQDIENLIFSSVNADYGHLARASESITYTSKHDNLVLWEMMQRAHGTDIHSYHGEEEKPGNWKDVYANDPYFGLSKPLSIGDMDTSNSADAVRSSLLAVGLVLTIQGIPFLHAGDEALRTKHGSGNSYKDNDEINAINWENKIDFGEAFEYQQGLIRLRNRHPAFRMDSKVVIADKIEEIHREAQFVAYKIGEQAGGDDWKNIYVAYNGSGEAKTVNFGNTDGPLIIVVDNTKAGVDSLGEIAGGDDYTLPPYSMVVAYDEVGVYDEPVLTSVKISPETADICEREEVTLGLTYLDQHGNEYYGAKPDAVTWESSDTSVALVDQKGVVTGLDAGTVTITASAGELGQVTATVTVKKQRYLVIQYTGATAQQADVWNWETGGRGGIATPFTAWVDGHWAALIPVSANVSKVEYIIRKVAANGWDDGNKDVESDQEIMLHPTDQFTVVRVTAGQAGYEQREPITGVGIPKEYIKIKSYSAVYDGAPHGISVIDTGGGAITYSASLEGTYDEASPTFTDAGTYTVYFRVERAAPWEVYKGTGTVTISMIPPLLQVQTPAASPDGGTFAGSQTVILTCSTTDALIYYTLDGSPPSAGSTLYSTPFTLTTTTTVNAIAIKAGMGDSAVLTVTYEKRTAATSPPATSSGSEIISGSGGETPVNIPATIDHTTGEVKLKLDAKVIETLITDAKAHENDITFDISDIKDARSVTFNAEAAEIFADAKVSVIMHLPGATITLTPDALALLTHTSGTGTTSITVEAKIVPVKDLNRVQAAQVKGYDTVVNIDVFVGKSKVDVPMTVSLPYKLKQNENPRAVCVWHMTDSGKLTRLDGAYSAETGMITTVIKHQSYFVVGYDPVALWMNIFDDVSEADWYFDAVAYANFNSLFVGDGKGHFLPKDNMTRAMFTTVVWNLEGKPGYKNTKSFADVSDGAWYHDAIVWAAENAVVSGTGNGRFEPDRAITHQEMAVLLVNYANYKGCDVPANRVLSRFMNSEPVAVWAEPSVRELTEAGVINDGDDLYHPSEGATRAEAASLFKNFLHLIIRDEEHPW